MENRTSLVVSFYGFIRFDYYLFYFRAKNIAVLSKQFSEDRIERVIRFQRKNHLYKLISQYRFRNSKYFKVSQIIRIGFIIFTLITIFLNTTSIFKQEAFITHVEIKYDENIPMYSLRGGGWGSNKPYHYTIITTNKNQFELNNQHNYFKEYDLIELNRNILGKFTSIEYRNHTIPLSKPYKWRIILLFITIGNILTFIFNDYQRKELRVLFHFFTFISLIAILLYYILL